MKAQRNNLGLGLLLLAYLAGCGPTAATYEVDLLLQKNCTTRSGEETCDNSAADSSSQTLTLEPRGEVVLLLLGETLFVAPQGTEELSGSRSMGRENHETGCASTSKQRLTVSPQGASIRGSYHTTTHHTGPGNRCGQTPFGEDKQYDLEGVEIEEP